MKKLKKFAKYGSLIAVLGTLILFGTDGYVKTKTYDAISSEKDILQSEEKADAILVLGAQVKPDGKPCLMLEERLNTGIQLYKKGAADRIIMSTACPCWCTLLQSRWIARRRSWNRRL